MTTKHTTVNSRTWSVQLSRKDAESPWDVRAYNGTQIGTVAQDPNGKAWLAVTLTGETFQAHSRRNAIWKLVQAQRAQAPK